MTFGIDAAPEQYRHLAEADGMRAPSLYKRLPSKEVLIV